MSSIGRIEKIWVGDRVWDARQPDKGYGFVVNIAPLRRGQRFPMVTVAFEDALPGGGYEKQHPMNRWAKGKIG